MILGNLEVQLSANIARLQRDMGDARRIVGETSSGISSAVEKMKQVLASIGLGAGLAQIIALSDQYAKFTAQLRLATQSQREYAQAYADVKRIATSAQSDLAATGTLYARIANGTRELGLAQKQVAAITESVNLSLKVSGATAAEAASAMLQMSQAFGSGTLRGEEFNAVNEAAPRLMKALADGMGVPVGALKDMASNGLITSQVMAEVLPKALEKLREEAAQVQTISGAFTVLKSNVMEFTGVHAQANGVVAVLTGSIGFLANNLTLLMGIVQALTAAKIGSWLENWVGKVYGAVTSNRALMASNLAVAESNVAATAASVSITNARVAELRAAVLAAEGNVALAITTNGLIPAQARATVAAEAHAAALAAQTVAMRAASAAGGVLRGVLAFFGGPVGAVIALLGLAATAWTVWGTSSEEGAKKSTDAVRESTEEILIGLDKQIEKLNQRNEIAKRGIPGTKNESSASVRLGEVVSNIDLAGRAKGQYAGLDLTARQAILTSLGREYGELTQKIEAFNKAMAQDEENKNKKSYGEWMKKYATKTEELTVELAKAQKELGAQFTPELETRIRKQFEVKDAGANKELEAYASLVVAVREKTAEAAREAAGLKPLNEAQKLQVALNEQIAAGKLKLTVAHKAAYEQQIKDLGVNIEVIASQKRAAEGAAAMAKFQKEIQDARTKSIDDGIKEAEKNEELARTFGMTKDAIEALELARLQEQLAQRSSLGLTIDEIATLEKLIEAKQRSAKALATVESLEDQKKVWESIEKTAHDTFINIFNSGKNAFDRLRDTLKNGLLELLYQMTIKKWLFNIGATVTGTGGIAGAAQAANSIGGAGNALGSAAGISGSLLSLGSTLNYGYTASGAAYGTGFGSQQSIMLAQQEAGMGLNASTGMAGTIASGVAGGLAAYGFGEKYGAGAGMVAGVGSVAAGGAIAGGLAGTGMAAGATAALAAIPVWGWAAIAAMAIIGGMQDGPEANTRLGFTTNNTPGAISINERGNEGRTGQSYIDGSSAGAFGTFGVSSSFWMNAAQPVVQDFIKAVTATDDALSQFMTTAERASVSVALTGRTMTAHMGAEGTNPNADGALDRVFAERMRAILDGVDSGLSSLIDGFAGTSQQLATEAGAILQFRTALKDSGEAVFGATVTLQDLAALKGPSEAVSAALARVTAIFNVTNAAAASMGMTTTEMFGTAGLASLAAREQLIQLSGGVENLGKIVNYFAETFTTDAERMAPVIKAVHSQMAAIGLADITTLERFKDKVFEVGAAALKGDAEAAKLYTTLLNIAPQFKAVDDYMKSLGATMSAFSDVAAKAATVATAQKAVSDALRAVENSLSSLGDRATETQKEVTSAQKAISQAYFSAQEAVAAAQRKVVDVTRQAVEGLQRLSTNIRDFLTGLRGGNSFDNYSALKAQLQTTAVLAQDGDVRSQEQLTTIAQKFLEVAQNGSASSIEYSREEAFVRRLLTGVADSVDARAAELLNATPAAGTPASSATDQANQELVEAQLRLLGYAAAAAASGASTDKSMQLVAGSAADLVAQFQLAREANAKAQIDYASALNLTSGMSLQSAGSINAFLSSLVELSSAQSALATAQGDLSKAIIDAASKSAVNAIDYAKSLGLTGEAATAFAKVMDDAKLSSSGYTALMQITGLSAQDLNLALGSSGVAADQMAIVLASAGTEGGTLASRLIDAHLTAQKFADQIKVSGLAADNLALIFGVSGKSSEDLKAMLDDAIAKGAGIGTALGTTKTSAQDLAAILTAAGLNANEFKDLIKTTGLSADALVAVLGAPGGSDGLRGVAIVAGVTLEAFTTSAQALGLTFGDFKDMLDKAGLTAEDFEKIKAVTGKPTEDLGLYLTMAGMSGKELAETLDAFKENATGLPANIAVLDASVLAVAALLAGGSTGDSIASALLGTGSTLVDLKSSLGLAGAAADTMAALMASFTLPTTGSAGGTAPLSTEQAFVTSLYSQILDRLPDATGLDYWSKNLKEGAITYENAALNIARGAAELSLAAGSYRPAGVTDGMLQSDITHGTAWLRAHNIPGFDIGTNYVSHDMLANIHAGEEITPRPFVDLQRAARDQANELLSRLVASNSEMRAELTKVRDAMEKTATNTKDTATNTGSSAGSNERSKDILEQVAIGQLSFQTREEDQ